ncbi:MAG: hypothetical protein SGPRY_010438 [Prymnesium sp.]
MRPAARAEEVLCNPLSPAAGTVTACMLTAREGKPRYDFCIENERGSHYACSAFLHEAKGEEGARYTIRLGQVDQTVVGGETFCSSLDCSVDNKRYTFNDDPSNFHSYPRELGAAIVSGNHFCVLLPRVDADGAAAQFRVLKPEESIVTRFFAGQAREHLMMLSGPWAPTEGEEIALVHLNTDSQQRGDVVFRARGHGDQILVDFVSPISAFQVKCLTAIASGKAFCIALALVHHAQYVSRVVEE